MTKKMKTGTYPTLCQDCATAQNGRAKLHGQPDKNRCEGCGSVKHSYDLGTYRITRKPEVAA